jgi:hypothetical protein
MIAYEKMLVEFCKNFSRKLQDGSVLNKEGTLNGACNGAYGKCNYWNLCKTPSEVSSVLEGRDFIISEERK